MFSLAHTSPPRVYKRSVLLKHLVVYSLGILLLVGAISILVEVQVVSRLSMKMEEENQNSLTHMAELFDSHWKNLQYISNNVSSNPKLLAYSSQKLGYDAYESSRELGRYLATYNFISDMGVYYRGSDSLFTTAGISSLDHFFTKQYQSADMDRESFVELCRNLSSPVLLPFSQVLHYGASPQDLALFIYPIPVHNMVPNGYVVYLIHLDDINAVLDTASPSGQSLVLLSSGTDTPLFSVNGEYCEPYRDSLRATLAGWEESEADSLLELDGEQFHVYRIKSAHNDFSYTVATPVDVYLSPVADVKRGFLVALGLISLLGFCYFLILTWHSYRPIQRLADSLRTPLSPRPKDSLPSELEWIAGHLDRMKDTNLSLQSSLEARQEFVRQQILFTLITKGDTRDTEELSKMLQTAQLEWTYPHFLIIALEIEPTGESDDGQAIAYFRDSVAEAFAPVGGGYCVDSSLENMVYFLLNYEAGGQEKNLIRQALASLRREMDRRWGCSVTAGVSKSQDDIHLLALSHKQAVKCLRYKMLKGMGSDIFYDELGHHMEYNVDLFHLCCESLKEALKTADYDKVQEALDGVLQQFEEQWEDPGILPYISYSIYLGLRSGMEQYNLSQQYEDQLYAVLMDEALPLPEIRTRYLEISRALCDDIQSLLKSYESSLKNKLVEYVDRNYTDRNLSLELIADHFKLSASYLTRYSKVHLGQPLMKYIDSIRMEQARNVLRTTSSPLDSVINQCGYVDKDNFCRKFKKSEGMTPLQYRKVYQTNQE